MSEARDNAGVIAHPPLIYLAGLAAGCGLEIVYPLGEGFLFAPMALFFAGCALFLLGAVLLVVCVQRFTREGTNVPTHLPSTAIVTSGPYRFSRNPIYVGLTLLYMALALLLNALWAFVFLPVILIVMQFGVVRREEAYLASKFPEEFQAYRSRVRRWF